MTVPQLDYLTDALHATYPERYRLAVEAGVVLNVYVPVAGGGLMNVKQGSAIVGLPTTEGRVHVYYEGDIFNRGMNYPDKLLHAADRMVTAYPTIATAHVGPDDVVQVGTYTIGAGVPLAVTDQVLLSEWLYS